ncbi:melanotransferrin [Bradysia coprophila]|uniref:melanotransferrin n=1 Tax=Bradysia coprophila TaxID=38358 RepID=UPI00187D9717|nr:melanotransferrin [Bradysia coprophila]
MVRNILQLCALSVIILIASLQRTANAQYYEVQRTQLDRLVWCNTILAEQYKCQNFTAALERDRALFDDLYFNVSCHYGFNTEECIQLIDSEKAHMMSLDAGEVFIAGRYNSLIPIMQEAFDGGFTNYYAVAVVKQGTIPEVTSIRDLRGKKACFSEVGSQAGWTIPIYTLQKEAGMEIVDCNNHVKSAINFFGKSCAVNSLTNKYNPIGDNSDRLCALCTGKVPGGKCTPDDPYAGFEGAFRCLLEAGDVAFLKHTTVNEMVDSKQFKSVTADRFELLCIDGQRRPLSEYRQCNWGLVPSHALVTSSARTADERKRYQQFLIKAVNLYSSKSISNATNALNEKRYDGFNTFDRNSDDKYYDRTQFRDFANPSFDRDRIDHLNSNRYNGLANVDSAFGPERNFTDGNDTQLYEKFELFESKRYGGRLNLMFQDAARNLVPIKEEDQSFGGYLGQSLGQILEVRQCPVGRMTLCVTSDPELEKCVKMRTALKAQLIKPEMNCYKAHSHINCMQAIQSGVADVTVLDASDVYTAGLRHDLIPFISEIYNLGEPEYYVVALAKEEDPDTELTYLKGKYTCHSGINTAAGWVYPLAYLISNGWIRPYGCDSIRAAAEYFTKSCVPGAISTEYNTGVPYDNMCDLCHGASYRYCRRDASEDYYGHTGAFRCLVEGGGHVAFVKHTTVSENTGGKRREWWARNTLNDDFELLCPDGTRADLKDFKTCNLGKVKANAIVTRGGLGYNGTQINAYINLFTYAQQYYGRKELDSFGFSMFYSLPPYHDLIFQDATRQLQMIPPEKRRYDLYLGGDFMRARRITDCESGAERLKFSLVVVMIVASAMYVFV